MKQLDRCVYFHLTPDTGEVFYIGVGTARRAKNFKERNRFWHRKVVKHGFPKVLIVADDLTIEKALEIEKFWIKFYGLKNLTNISPGGDSSIGFYPSEETRLKLSQILSGKGNPFYGKTHSAETKLKISIKKKGCKLSEECKSKIGKAHTGMKRPIGTGMKIGSAQKGNLNHAYDIKIYTFAHSCGVVETCTQYDLRHKYNLNSGHLSQLIKGKLKSHKGWKIIHHSID